MPSIAIMTLWWTVGGPSILLLAGLQQIPEQYYEAGALDGAVGWRRFWYLTLPLVRPVLLFVIVMNVIGAFQVFGQTFMITRGGPELSTRVLMQYVYETSFNNYHMGYGAAMSWLLFGIIAVVSYFQFRIMRENR
jgi:multiple sugar transport system permease protein